MSLGSVDSLTSVVANPLCSSLKLFITSECAGCALLLPPVSDFLPTFKMPFLNERSVTNAESPFWWTCEVLKRDFWAISMIGTSAFEVVLLVAWVPTSLDCNGWVMFRVFGCIDTAVRPILEVTEDCRRILLGISTSDFFFLSGTCGLPHHSTYWSVSMII